MFTQDYCAFNSVLKFSYISGPPVFLQGKHHFFRNDSIMLLIMILEFFQEMLNKRINVFRTFKQSGNMNLNRVNPIVKIFPEFSFLNKLFDVAVRGTNKTNISFDGIIRS